MQCPSFDLTDLSWLICDVGGLRERAASSPAPQRGWMGGAQELGSGGQALHAFMIVTVLAKFLYLFAASMCLGLAFGLGTSFLMKTFRSNSVPQARAGACEGLRPMKSASADLG